jgi:hypothetical protein
MHQSHICIVTEQNGKTLFYAQGRPYDRNDYHTIALELRKESMIAAPVSLSVSRHARMAELGAAAYPASPEYGLLVDIAPSRMPFELMEKICNLIMQGLQTSYQPLYLIDCVR